MIIEEAFMDIVALHRQGHSIRFIAKKLGMHRNTRTDSGSPGVGTIGRAEKLIEPIPFDDLGQLDKPMAGIDDAAEINPEQIVLPIVVGRFLRFNAFKNCKLLGG